MMPSDVNSPKLTAHDKEVLQRIIDHAKIPDSEIAKAIGISPQAVFKIRSKLENLGIIKGYMPIVDYRKIGITMMVVLVIRLTSSVWEKFTDDLISDRISRMPYVLGAYRVSDARASHILLMGFRDVHQKEQYLSQIQTKFAKEIEIKDVYSFSVDKIILQNPLGILSEIIDKKEFSPYEFFPPIKK